MNKLALLFAVLLCLPCGPAAAGGASDKLHKLADGLIADHAAKAGPGRRALAVFPLNCDAALEKKKVGFAASEIMSHRFVANTGFVVVERGELGKLLYEQKLQASGAVDGDTSVKLGKFLGASVVLVGNIQKVGAMYQVNARLVDVETSGVLVSGYAELDSAVFEDDARSYLDLAPEVQSLGLYFLYNSRSNSNQAGVMRNTAGCGGATCTRNAFTLGLVGVGVRYSPVKKVYMDVSAMKSTGAPYVGKFQSMRIGVSATSIRGVLGYQAGAWGKLSLSAGIGAAGYSISRDASANYVTPVVHARLEYRAQARLGLSVAAGYDLKSKVASSVDDWAELDKFYFEPAVSLFF